MPAIPPLGSIGKMLTTQQPAGNSLLLFPGKEQEKPTMPALLAAYFFRLSLAE